MKQLEPRGLGYRVAEALTLLVATSWGAHWVYELLRPLVPVALSGLAVVLVAMAVLRRRRW